MSLRYCLYLVVKITLSGETMEIFTGESEVVKVGKIITQPTKLGGDVVKVKLYIYIYKLNIHHSPIYLVGQNKKQDKPHAPTPTHEGGVR